MSIVTMISAPLSYLRIKHKEKFWFDIVVPLIFSVFFSLLYSVLSRPFPLLSNGGLIPQVNSLLQMLIGFYIASLAAIATFNNEKIDNLMSGEPPTLKIKEKGVVVEVPLTRRKFLCYLFGYLAFMGVVLYVVGVISTLVNYSASGFIKNLVLSGAVIYIKSIFLFIYSFGLVNLVITTMLGLYYLSVRIHE